MQGQLRLFIFGVVALAALIGLGVWWLGTNMVHLAFFAEGRDEPFIVMDFHGPAEGYTGIIRSGEEERPVKLHGQWQLVNVLEGRRSDEWRHLTVTTYSEASSVIQFITGSAYRDYTEQNPEFESLMLGSRTQLIGNLTPVLVVLMAAEVKPEMNSLTRLITELPADADLLWQGEVDDVDVDSGWQHGVLLGFSDLASAVAFATNDKMKLQREITRSRAEGLLMAIYVNNPPSGKI